MAMNSTLKSICDLLKHPDSDLQIAAVRVLGAIQFREPSVVRALGELLLHSDSVLLQAAILKTLRMNPHEYALRYLLQMLDRDTGHEESILDVIAAIGGKAVTLLKQQFSRTPLAVRCKISAVLPRIRTPQAHAFLIDCYCSGDNELIRDSVHALREEIEHYPAREKSDLMQRLFQALKDKRKSEAALSAILISLGILGDVKAKGRLLAYVTPEHPQQIRRHALLSLGRFEYPGDKHHDIFDALTPLLDEEDYDGLVRHAVQVLMKIKPRRADQATLRDLIHSRHEGVGAYAIQALSQLDTITNATLISEFLHATKVQLRDAASEALRRMPSAVDVILRQIDEVKDRSEAFEMVKILEDHGNRIKPDRARKMIRHMLELYYAGDEHYQLYRAALLHLRPDAFQKELDALATGFETEKDWEKARDTLKLLDHTPLLTPDVRFRLAVAKLRTSKKDIARTFRLSDYCLEHIAGLLHEDPKGFQKRFLAEKALEPEDYFYVGYHFSEKMNEERRFGVDVLQHVVKRWSRKPAAALARKKLKVEGH